MNEPRSPEEIINPFPKNWEEAKIVIERCLMLFQKTMASDEHNELELYIMYLEKTLPLMHDVLNLRRIEIRSAETETCQMVIKNDTQMDPDMEVTRVDVPRSNPSWPVPERRII